MNFGPLVAELFARRSAAAQGTAAPPVQSAAAVAAPTSQTGPPPYRVWEAAAFAPLADHIHASLFKKQGPPLKSLDALIAAFVKSIDRDRSSASPCVRWPAPGPPASAAGPGKAKPTVLPIANAPVVPESPALEPLRPHFFQLVAPVAVVPRNTPHPPGLGPYTVGVEKVVVAKRTIQKGRVLGVMEGTVHFDEIFESTLTLKTKFERESRTFLLKTLQKDVLVDTEPAISKSFPDKSRNVILETDPTSGFYSWVSEINDVAVFREEEPLPILAAINSNDDCAALRQNAFYCSLCECDLPAKLFFERQQRESRDAVRVCNLHGFRNASKMRRANIERVEIDIMGWPWVFIVARETIKKGQELLMNYGDDWDVQWTSRENYKIYDSLLLPLQKMSERILPHKDKTLSIDWDQLIAKAESDPVGSSEYLQKSLKPLSDACALTSATFVLMAALQTNDINTYELGENMRKDVVEDDLSLVDPVDWKVVNGLSGADDEMRDSNGKHEYLELVKHGELSFFE
ncbi:hypothetical protein HDU83_002503 [Entophlyctis luteolus]|nr:hypothetical protein HDU83_002503 [Entophlyctis luteolus]